MDQLVFFVLLVVVCLAVFMTGGKKKKQIDDRPVFRGKLLQIGAGQIGNSVVPMIIANINFENRPEDHWHIITGADCEQNARESGIPFTVTELTPENYREVLDGYDLRAGDFLLDLSVNVSSKALIEYCWERSVLYLNTAVNPWKGKGDFYDPDVEPKDRINYKYLEELKGFRKIGPTTVVGFGINPGLVSMWVKRALRKLAAHRGIASRPVRQEDWAALARQLGVQAIQISEYDGQRRARQRENGTFGNTWSVTGFVDELVQAAELGWGSHEKIVPKDMRFYDTNEKTIAYLMKMGGETLVRSWAPLAGPFVGFCIPHLEAITISKYLQIDGYRPTVYYAYRPCDEAMLSVAELRGKGWELPVQKRDMTAEELEEGIDEIGVFLMGEWSGKPFAYWSGSRLDSRTALSRCDKNTATTLQVNSAIVATMLWMFANPTRGLVVPEELDDEFVLPITDPYTEPMRHVFSNWNPTSSCSKLFPAVRDEQSVFQFANFRAD